MRPVIVFASIVIIGGMLVLAAINGKNSAESENSESSNNLPADTVVYDVRTPEEYATSHGEGAVLLSLAEIQNGTYPDVAKDAPIAVYCRSGNRSGQATAILERAGYTNIIDIGALSNLKSYGIATI